MQNFSPRGVKHYEIWNEPNQYFWWKPKPSPRGYTALLRAAYPAAKSADRGVTIIAGAFAPTADSSNGSTIRSTTYVRNLYDNGARSYFDAISIHPYTRPNSPLTQGDWNMISGVMPDIYATMRSHGDGAKKIWGTEMGFPTSGKTAVSEQQQGLFLQQAFQLWTKYPYTAALMVFNYRDRGHEPSGPHRELRPRAPRLLARRRASERSSKPCRCGRTNRRRNHPNHTHGGCDGPLAAQGAPSMPGTSHRARYALGSTVVALSLALLAGALPFFGGASADNTRELLRVSFRPVNAPTPSRAGAPTTASPTTAAGPTAGCATTTPANRSR